MKDHCIYNLFLETARLFPDKLAVESGQEELTYVQLMRRANTLASKLINTGIPAGAVVAILSNNSAQVITAILAILQAGCVFAPFDPAGPGARLKSMLSEADPSCILLDPAADISARLWAELTKPPVVAQFDLREEELPVVMRRRDPDDLCYIYFTSGSTGRPKGIAGRLKSIRHFIEWEIETFSLNETTRVSQLVPPVFDAFLRDLFVPLCAGGTICVPPTKDLLIEPSRLVDWLHTKKLSLVHTVPSVFRSILRARLARDRFPSLQYILLSGEVLLPSDVMKWRSLFGDRIQLVNLYGPSETTMVKLFNRIQPDDEKRRSIPVGRPMPQTEVFIVDPRDNACPPGIPGELYIRTPYRSLGYYNQPEATSQSFVSNPFGSDPNDIVYRTGDLARLLPDGRYEFIGRIDQQVKIGGVRIEMAEIENCLLKIPGVSEAIVVVRENGEDKYLCAYVIGETGLDSAKLKKLLAPYLPHHLIPAKIFFVDELPKTPSGKIDRNQLAADNIVSAPPRMLQEPQTQIEKELVGIWKAVLVEESIGIEDDFFAIGGNSLAAMQLLARVAERYGVNPTIQELFQAPTIAAMAEQIESAIIANSPSVQVSLLLDHLEAIDDGAANCGAPPFESPSSH